MANVADTSCRPVSVTGVSLTARSHDFNATATPITGHAGMTDAIGYLFAPDGAWCWFQDPRAVYFNRQHERTYAGWMTGHGNLEVGAFDHATGDGATLHVEDPTDRPTTITVLRCSCLPTDA